MAKSTASGSGIGTSIPSGVIMPFGGTVVPQGWLLCDGTTVSRSSFRDLFNVIGTAYGEGDGASTFHVPDLRGAFIRGVDNPTGSSAALRDPDAGSRTVLNTGGNSGDAVGSYQGDAIQNHYHQVTNAGTNATQSGADNWVGGPNVFSHTLNSSNPLGASTSTETRPRNVAVNYIIKV